MSSGERDTNDILGELQGKGDQFTKLCVIERKRLADLEDAIEHITNEITRYRDSSNAAAVALMNHQSLAPHPSFTKADAADVSRFAAKMAMKILSSKEVKLNKLLQRKSEIINGNKQIKSDVDHFRRLRLQTDSTHSKFEAILADTKAGIEMRLSESTAVVEERERCIEKKEALERINLEEQRAFMEEYEAKGAFIRQQNEALELALFKERKDDTEAAAKAYRSSHHMPPLTSTQTPHVTESSPIVPETTPSPMHNNAAFSFIAGISNTPSPTHIPEGNPGVVEVDMVKQVNDLNGFVTREQHALTSISDKISTYETMFEQLKKMTGADRLEELVSTYVAHEEEMFSLYNFIQTINAEIDTAVEAYNLLEGEKKEYREKKAESDNQRELALKTMQERLQLNLEAASEAEELSKQHHDSVQQVSKKVSSLFYKLQCDQMDAKSASAQPTTTGGGMSKSVKGTNMTKADNKIAYLTSQGISESNVLAFMGCVEQRAVEIISEYLRTTHFNSHIQAKSGTPSISMLSVRKAASLNMRHLSPTPGPSSPMALWPIDSMPEVGDISDEDFHFDLSDQPEGDSRPVDLQTFKDNMLRKLGLTQMSSPVSRSLGVTDRL